MNKYGARKGSGVVFGESVFHMVGLPPKTTPEASLGPNTEHKITNCVPDPTVNRSALRPGRQPEPVLARSRRILGCGTGTAWMVPLHDRHLAPDQSIVANWTRAPSKRVANSLVTLNSRR